MDEWLAALIVQQRWKSCKGATGHWDKLRNSVGALAIFNKGGAGVGEAQLPALQEQQEVAAEEDELQQLQQLHEQQSQPQQRDAHKHHSTHHRSHSRNHSSGHHSSSYHGPA